MKRLIIILLIMITLAATFLMGAVVNEEMNDEEINHEQSQAATEIATMRGKIEVLQERLNEDRKYIKELEEALEAAEGD